MQLVPLCRFTKYALPNLKQLPEQPLQQPVTSTTQFGFLESPPTMYFASNNRPLGGASVFL